MIQIDHQLSDGYEYDCFCRMKWVNTCSRWLLSEGFMSAVPHHFLSNPLFAQFCRFLSGWHDHSSDSTSVWCAEHWNCDCINKGTLAGIRDLNSLSALILFCQIPGRICVESLIRAIWLLSVSSRLEKNLILFCAWYTLTSANWIGLSDWITIPCSELLSCWPTKLGCRLLSSELWNQNNWKWTISGGKWDILGRCRKHRYQRVSVLTNITPEWRVSMEIRWIPQKIGLSWKSHGEILDVPYCSQKIPIWIIKTCVWISSLTQNVTPWPEGMTPRLSYHLVRVAGRRWQVGE